MSDAAREQNYERLIDYVQKYTSQWWGESFVSELTRISTMAEKKRALKAAQEERFKNDQKAADANAAKVDKMHNDNTTTEEQAPSAAGSFTTLEGYGTSS